MAPRKCEVCGETPAIGKCSICGRWACAKHFDASRGICALCSETLCSFCSTRLSIGYCSICGRLGCDQCMVQIDSVRWVCRECMRRLGGAVGRIRVATSARPGRAAFELLGGSTTL